MRSSHRLRAVRRARRARPQRRYDERDRPQHLSGGRCAGPRYGCRWNAAPVRRRHAGASPGVREDPGLFGDLERRRLLRPNSTIVENRGEPRCRAGRARRYRCVAVVGPERIPESLERMRRLRAWIDLVDGPDDAAARRRCRARARRLPLPLCAPRKFRRWRLRLPIPAHCRRARRSEPMKSWFQIIRPTCARVVVDRAEADGARVRRGQRHRLGGGVDLLRRALAVPRVAPARVVARRRQKPLLRAGRRFKSRPRYSTAESRGFAARLSAVFGS